MAETPAATADALASSLAAQAVLGEAAAPDAADAPARNAAGEAESEEERGLCRVCNGTPRNVVWTACGHCVVCEACHREVMRLSAKCVLCALPILEDSGVLVLDLAAFAPQPGGLQPARTYMPEQLDAAAAELARAAAGGPREVSQRQVAELRRLMAVLAAGGDADALVPAVADVRRILSNQNNTVLDALLQVAFAEGVMVHLIALMQRVDALVLQAAAMATIGQIVLGDGFAMQVIQAGAVPHLLRLVESTNVGIVDEALMTIGNIAGESRMCRDRLLTAGAVAPILAALDAPNVAAPEAGAEGLILKRRIAWVLANLCRGKPQPPFEAVKPMLPALMRLVQGEDEEVLQEACWALSYVSDGTNDKIEAVLETGVCSRLVGLLVHPSPEVIVPALRAMGNIVTGNDQQTQKALDCGVLRRLLDLVTLPYTKNIKKEACWAISNITAGNQDQIQAVLDANLAGPLIQLLASAEFEIKKEVAWALGNATGSSTAEQIRHLVGEGCVKPMCDLLTCHDARIVTVAMEGLQHILKMGASDRDEAGGSVNQYAKFVEEAGGVEKLNELQSHSDIDVVDHANIFLELYFKTEEES